MKRVSLWQLKLHSALDQRPGKRHKIQPLQFRMPFKVSVIEVIPVIIDFRSHIKCYGPNLSAGATLPVG